MRRKPEPSRASDDPRSNSDASSDRRGRLRRPIDVFRALVDVRDDERSVLKHAGLFLFSVLAANYLVRPIRDEMGVAGGPEHLPILFTATLASMLLIWPVFSTWLGRRGTGNVIGPILRAQQTALLGFFVAFTAVPSWGFAWAARLYFVWASVTSLLVVSVAWGSLAGRFTSDQGGRLFGLIAAGGALGGIAGSTLAGVVGRSVGPAPLLLPAVLFLEIGLRAGRRAMWNAGRAASTVDSTGPPAPARSRSSPGDGAYLTCLGLWTLLFTSTSAFIYLEQARIVEASIGDPAVRTAFFARIDLLVNVVGLVVQLALTGWILDRLGAGAAAAMLPAVTIAGMIALNLRPTLATIQWFQVARRGMDYAVARPSREVFYTVVEPTRLLRAKGLIDTAVYRAGDAAGAWSHGLLAAATMGPNAVTAAVAAVSVVWIALSLGLGGAMNRRIACTPDRNYSP